MHARKRAALRRTVKLADHGHVAARRGIGSRLQPGVASRRKAALVEQRARDYLRSVRRRSIAFQPVRPVDAVRAVTRGFVTIGVPNAVAQSRRRHFRCTDRDPPHSDAMKRSRGIATLGSVLVLGIGMIRFVQYAASSPSDHVGVSASERSEIGDLAAKLEASSKLTYTAAYKLPEGTTATVVQQPPDVAFAGPTGRFIFTRDAMYRCSPQPQPATCEKVKNTNEAVDLDTDQAIPGWIGPGFVTARTAGFTLIAAALLGSNYMTDDRGERAFAGVQSTCLGLTTLLPDYKFYLGLGAFDICVADNGVLTSFDGFGDRGKVGVELTSYAETADPAAFQPPAGYRIVNVESLIEPSGSPSAPPSASPSASALR